VLTDAGVVHVAVHGAQVQREQHAEVAQPTQTALSGDGERAQRHVQPAGAQLVLQAQRRRLERLGLLPRHGQHLGQLGLVGGVVGGIAGSGGLLGPADASPQLGQAYDGMGAIVGRRVRHDGGLGGEA